MREIPLTQGKVAIVDDDDFDWLRQFTWYATSSRSQTGRLVWYARRYTADGMVYMHRQVAERSGIVGTEVDHRDLDGLHNWRTNLRAGPRSSNAANQPKRNGFHSSRYKGIHWHKGRLQWHAQITVNYHKTHLGYFPDEIEAALAYDRSARFFFGQFARTNFCYHTTA